MAKMKVNDFRHQFLPHDRVRQAVGSGERVLYTSELASDGEIVLTPTGKEDLYASIQSHKDSCDIYVLLSRYQNGDAEALSRVQGHYGDFTDVPKTYAELLNSVIAGKAYFESLPVETRANFDHSFEKFMMSMDDMDNFVKLLGYAENAKDASPIEQPGPAPSASEKVPNE